MTVPGTQSPGRPKAPRTGRPGRNPSPLAPLHAKILPAAALFCLRPARDDQGLGRRCIGRKAPGPAPSRRASSVGAPKARKPYRRPPCCLQRHIPRRGHVIVPQAVDKHQRKYSPRSKKTVGNTRREFPPAVKTRTSSIPIKWYFEKNLRFSSLLRTTT